MREPPGDNASSFTTLASSPLGQRIALYAFMAVPPLFFLFTTAPGLGHADQAILIESMYRLQMGSGATEHNLTILAGYLFSHLLPFGDIAYRCNLVSTFFGGAGVSLAFLLVLRVTRSTPVSVFSTLFLMVSHSLWWHSTVAEDYAVNILFCVAVLLCLVRLEESGRPPWLYAAAFLGGLAIFNHAQMGLWLPALILVACLPNGAGFKPSATVAFRAAVFYGAGLVPYAAIFARDAAMHGFLTTLNEAFGGDFRQSFLSVGSWSLFREGIVDTATLFMVQWGWPSIFHLYILIGLWRSFVDTDLPVTCGAVRVAFLLNTLFFAFDRVWDKYAFLLPSFILAHFIGTLGLKWVWARSGLWSKHSTLALALVNVVFCLYPLYFFETLPRLARHSALWARYATDARSLNATFDGAYLARPDKADFHSTQHFAGLVVERLPPGSVVVDQIARTFFHLTSYYQHVLGKRPDLRVFALVPYGVDPARWPSGLNARQAADLIERSLAARPVFLTTLWGCDATVMALLRHNVTLLEYTLDSTDSVFQARVASSVDMGSWVESAQVGPRLDRQPAGSPPCCRFPADDAPGIGVLLRFKRHNPPMLIRVVWHAVVDGTSHPGEAYPVAFDVPPVWYKVRPPTVLTPGRWVAEVYAFDQVVESLAFEVEPARKDGVRNGTAREPGPAPMAPTTEYSPGRHRGRLLPPMAAQGSLTDPPTDAGQGSDTLSISAEAREKRLRLPRRSLNGRKMKPPPPPAG
jgi:Protein O-mannosyl-transferase TMEM260-like